MKILLYGFKSYTNWKKNITETIVKKVKKQKNLVKVVFPVKFNKSQFLKAIKKHDPDVIIGLGQHSKGRKIKIERKAYNWKKVNNKAKRKVILKDKDPVIFLNFKLKTGSNAWKSYHILDDINNFSMYVIQDKFEDKVFGFFNIPRKYDMKKAAFYVEDLLVKLNKELSQKLAQKSLRKFF